MVGEGTGGLSDGVVDRVPGDVVGVIAEDCCKQSFDILDIEIARDDRGIELQQIISLPISASPTDKPPASITAQRHHPDAVPKGEARRLQTAFGSCPRHPQYPSQERAGDLLS